MIQKMFKASYDQAGDVLTICSPNKVHESVEVAEELILDLDKRGRLANIELLDAFKFLHTLNNDITKEMLGGIDEVEVRFTNYRNYWILTLVLQYDNKTIEEKLPAFAWDYKSPLVASA